MQTGWRVRHSDKEDHVACSPMRCITHKPAVASPRPPLISLILTYDDNHPHSHGVNGSACLDAADGGGGGGGEMDLVELLQRHQLLHSGRRDHAEEEARHEHVALPADVPRERILAVARQLVLEHGAVAADWLQPHQGNESDSSHHPRVTLECRRSHPLFSRARAVPIRRATVCVNAPVRVVCGVCACLSFLSGPCRVVAGRWSVARRMRVGPTTRTDRVETTRTEGTSRRPSARGAHITHITTTHTYKHGERSRDCALRAPMCGGCRVLLQARPSERLCAPSLCLPVCLLAPPPSRPP